jgi:hypothetical protein
MTTYYEIIDEIEEKTTEYEQRAILGRLKCKKEKINEIERLEKIKDEDELKMMLYTHCYYYNKILELKEEEIENYIRYMVEKYPNPNWAYAIDVVYSKIETNDYEMACKTFRCYNIAYKRGLCMTCRSRDDEKEIYMEIEKNIEKILLVK